MLQVLRILDNFPGISHSYIVKLSKQQLGLMIVAGAGLGALAVDHFILRPDGGLSAAAAAVVVEDEGSPLEGEPNSAAAKAIIDRSSALIADRIDRIAAERKQQSRDAFSELWSVRAGEEAVATENAPVAPVSTAPVNAPWKLTSVSSIGGKLAIVLLRGERDTVLTVGNGAADDAELIEAFAASGTSPSGEKRRGSWAKVRQVSTGNVFELVLEPLAATSEKR